MTIEDDVERLYVGEKGLAMQPGWHYSNAHEDRWELSVPLEIDYVTEEGFYLESQCVRSLPDANVSTSLIYKPAGGLHGPICRLDWLPTAPHSNQGRINGSWQWKKMSGTHLHGYELNKHLGWAKMAKDNLPIALPVDDPLTGFRDMLTYVGKIWKIRDIQRIPEPEWMARLT